VILPSSPIISAPEVTPTTTTPALSTQDEVINYVSKVLDQMRQLISGMNPFAVKPTTAPPTNSQPTTPPPNKTSGKASNGPILLQIYQKIIKMLVDLLNIFFPKAK
jgi:hypothetical protein